MDLLADDIMIYRSETRRVCSREYIYIYIVVDSDNGQPISLYIYMCVHARVYVRAIDIPPESRAPEVLVSRYDDSRA